MSDIAGLARSLQGAQGLRIGRIEFFGQMMVRPDDWTYELSGVFAESDHLRLQLADDEGKPTSDDEHAVRVFDPGAWTFGSDGLTIAAASHVRWGARDVQSAPGAAALLFGRSQV